MNPQRLYPRSPTAECTDLRLVSAIQLSRFLSDKTPVVRTLRFLARKNIIGASSAIFEIWKKQLYSDPDIFFHYMLGTQLERSNYHYFGISPDEAFERLSNAANLKSLFAMSWLALIYDGVVMDKANIKSAAYWYRQASVEGCPYAQFNLASAIQAGKIEPNSEQELGDLLDHVFSSDLDVFWIN